MGKTYRTAWPIPANDNTNVERSVKESNFRRISKAFKKLTHHRERRTVQSATIREMEEAV